MVVFKMGGYEVLMKDSKFYILLEKEEIKECNSIKEAVFFINNKTKHLL